MAGLPRGASLLDNPVNKMPAFSLDERFMVEEILKKLIPHNKIYYRHTLTALCRENELIEVMEKMPKGVEFSSLPKLYSDGWRVSISVASDDEKLAFDAFQMYLDLLEGKNITYGLHDESNH